MAKRVHTVLIVEDERIVAKDLQQTIEAMGYEALEPAVSADEAVKRASERCPDLVLMDIRIKGKLDGIEAAQLLRARFGVPVVYLTAHADEATIERAKRTEPAGYLVKPVKSAELRSAIEVAIYRHEMEKRQRERDRWFATTLRSIGDAVIAVDLAGQVTFMNPAAETLTGVTAAQSEGRPVREIVRLVDSAHPESPLDAVLEQRKNLVIGSAELARPGDQARRIISDTASMVVDDDQVLGAVMVFRDVTEQTLLQRQLELRDRLASLGSMAAGVVHEINNPLAVVVANAAFVLVELQRRRAALAPDDEAGRVALDSAIAAQQDLDISASRITRIVSELKTFSRPLRAPGGSADLSRAVAWAVRATAHEFRTRATLSVELPPDLPRVVLDETRLGQVVVNLLVNAAHAIASGRFDANTVTVRARHDASRVVLEVQDTGSGIPPEILSRIFEPFFTTKEIGDGTGLGLAICHGIVTSAGGAIEVTSEPGRGTTFRVLLRIASPDPVEAAAPMAPVVTAPTRRGRILAIDDEPLALHAVARTLREHEVVCTEDAREAIAMLDRGETFDLILSDVMMPNMNGVELYERLLALHPDAARRVVFLTAGAGDPRIADFLAAVPNAALEKPISADALRRYVAQQLRATR